MSERFFRWIGILSPRDTLVKVKSWMPARGPYGIEWPVLLIDTFGGFPGRSTISPVWNRARFRGLFFKDTPHDK